MAGSHTLQLRAGDVAGNNATKLVAFEVALAATARVEPETLNLRSSGNWVTGFVTFPSGFNSSTINVSSTVLVTPDGSSIPAETKDRNPNGEIVLKFNRTRLQNSLLTSSITGNVTLRIVGTFDKGTFIGTDTIRVIQ